VELGNTPTGDKIFGFSPKVAILALLAFGLTLRFFCIAVLDIKPYSDYQIYLTMASNLYDGIGLVDPFNSLAVFSPGYPIFLYCLFLITGKSVAAAQFVNVLLGGVSILLVYFIGVELIRSRVAAFLGATLWSIYLPAILYTEYLAKENLMIPVLLSMVLLIGKYPSSKWQIPIAAGLGMLMGIQALVGPAALTFLPIIIFQMFITQNSVRNKIRNLGVLIICTAIILAPWLYRNYNLWGKPILINNTGWNLYLGNNPAATGMYISVKDTPLGSEAWNELRREIGEAGADNYAKRLAIEYIINNPIDTLFLSIKKMTLFWWPPTHDGEDGNQSKLESISRSIWLLEYSLMMILALGSLVFIRIRSDHLWILYTSILLYTSIHMVFIVIIRYRLTIMPIICLLSGLCIWLVFEKFIRNKMGLLRE